jgi:16S rRNA (guanine527-N7)-methyltransferase
LSDVNTPLVPGQTEKIGRKSREKVGGLETAFHDYLDTDQTVSQCLSATQRKQLLAYTELVVKWNSVFNLTAVRNPDDMLVQHLLDCIWAVVLMQSQLINFHSATTPMATDVGSGAGLPGVAMAIIWPHWQVVCVDTVSKKAAFINQVRAELGLGNLVGHHGRIEAFNPVHEFGLTPLLVTCRAYSSLEQFVNTSGHLLGPDSLMIAMKGKRNLIDEELLQAQTLIAKYQLRPQVLPVAVPGLHAERHLVVLQR